MMKHERRELPLEEAQAGMVLADDVCDARGTVLLPKGAGLTETALTSLARRGVEVLAVLVPLELTDDQIAARQAELTQRLDWLFRLVGNDEPARVLKEQIGLYMQER